MAGFGIEAGQNPRNVLVATALLLAILGVSLLRARFTRTFVVVPWSLAFFAAMALLAAPAGPERRLVLIAAVATLFASFSSPFLTAAFTFGVFVVGRSSDTLSHLPERAYGHLLHTIG